MTWVKRVERPPWAWPHRCEPPTVKVEPKQGWHCYDEHDRSLHPLQDTLDEAAEQIRWVLDQIGTMLGGPDA